MSDDIISVPRGVVYWFPPFLPAELVLSCPHDCDHAHFEVVAWGPDEEHYELLQCGQLGAAGLVGGRMLNGCNCRAWRPRHASPCAWLVPAAWD